MARQPPPPPDATELRGQLGRGVRALRKRAGLTQEELGELVSYTQGQISRLEKGYKINAGVLDQVLRGLDATAEEAAGLRELNRVNERGWGPENPARAAAPWFARIQQLEPVASAVLSWTGERIKGLLQAESYMIEQFRGHGVDDITNAVSEREARATRAFTENPGCRYEFLLSASAIERLVRCRTENGFVALDQLKHLLALGKRHPGLSLRVVPFDGPLHVDPDFTIMEFPDERPALGYSELPHTLVTTDRGDLDIEQLYRCWTRLRQAALGDEETSAYLEDSLSRCHGSP